MTQSNSSFLPSPVAALASPAHRPDELLVQFAPGAAALSRSEAAQAIGGREEGTIHTRAMQKAGRGVLSVVKLPAGTDLDRAAEILARRPGVVSVDRDWTISIDATSNDPGYTGNQLWGMEGDATSPANAYGTGAGEAWAAGFTGSSKVVAGVIDTGIDYRHPDLYLNVWLNQGEIPAALKTALKDITGDGLITFRDLNAAENAGSVKDLNGNARIDAGDLLADSRWENGADTDGNGYVDDLIGWDFVNNDNDPLDDNKHGTHVSGTIAGIGGNGTGVAGVAWDAQLVALKSLGASGSGSSSTAIKAVDYFTAASVAAGGSADFVATNNSWGGGGYSTALRDAIERASNQDALFVAAAGNSSANLDSGSYYPAEYDTTFNGGLDAVVTVASITSSGALSSFSNYGASSVDIAAPGSSIYSTVPNGGYASLSGTSMATPHVTGAALLYAASHAGATGDQVRHAILDTAKATSSLAGKTITGGRLDVGAMMGGTTTPPPPPPPTLSIAAASAAAAEGSSGSKAFGFTVTRAGGTTGAASVGWSVVHGTTSAADFAGATSGTLSFAAGETTKAISVLVAGDTAVEPDETFSVLLSGASGASIGTSMAGGTIRNDDTATTPPPPPPEPTSGDQPTALEQYMLELMNRERLNPTASAQRYGFSLSDSTPRQALAWNTDLGEAAQLHTDDMFARRTLTHTGPDGSTSRERMIRAGYEFSGSNTSGENVAMRSGSGRGLSQANVDALHQQFMTSSGHRANILNNGFEEAGVGLSGDSTNSWTTEDFAGTSARGPFLTGVAFDDRDGDRSYDVGEGLGGVTVAIRSAATGTLTQLQTWAAGGYQTKLASGTYDVTFSGGGLAAPVTKSVTMGTRNVKLDLDADAPGAVTASAPAQAVAFAASPAGPPREAALAEGAGSGHAPFDRPAAFGDFAAALEQLRPRELAAFGEFDAAPSHRPACEPAGFGGFAPEPEPFRSFALATAGSFGADSAVA